MLEFIATDAAGLAELYAPVIKMCACGQGTCRAEPEEYYKITGNLLCFLSCKMKLYNYLKHKEYEIWLCVPHKSLQVHDFAISLQLYRSYFGRY